MDTPCWTDSPINVRWMDRWVGRICTYNSGTDGHQHGKGPDNKPPSRRWSDGPGPPRVDIWTRGTMYDWQVEKREVNSIMEGWTEGVQACTSAGTEGIFREVKPVQMECSASAHLCMRKLVKSIFSAPDSGWGSLRYWVLWSRKYSMTKYSGCSFKQII